MSLVCNLIERTLARHAAAGTDLPPGIERHLEGCSSCRQCLAELTALGERLSASVTLPEAPPDLTEPARLLLASGAVRPARRPAPRLAVGGLAAGVLMVGALAGRWLPGSRTARRPEPQPPVPAAASTQAGPAGPVAAHPAPRLEAPEPRRRRVPVQEPTTSRFTGVTGGSPTLGSAAEDSRYLNGEDQELQRYWLGNRASSELRRLWTTKLPPMRDDFVLPRPVLLATTGSAGVRKAVDEYTKEAAVVDARLFKKVTLGLKGASLLELCEVLQKETGVRFQPARITADEKVTVFVTDRPTRDVMRQVARLFGFVWARSGESGAYRYELVQTLRAQLTEEEMRQQDQNGALLALDARMQADAALLDLPLTELKARAKEGPQSERERAGLLLRGGWGGAQLFRRLSLPDLLRLRGGQEVTHQIFTDDSASRLPPEWKPALLETGRELTLDPNTGKWVALTDFPDARMAVSLRVDRSELGQWTLRTETSCYSATAGYGLGVPRTLAVGKSPSVENPDNARANAALRGQAPYTRRVSLAPRSTRTSLKQWSKPGETIGASFDDFARNEAPRPQVMSDDVWEEIHRKTGLPIVADYYTHLYNQAPLTFTNVTLFEALCRSGDALGLRWKRDGEFLLARSTGFFWDKLKEVPNRSLKRWAADREQAGGLPLQDVLEMSAHTEHQLSSAIVGEGIVRGWGLPEWTISGGGSGHRPMRPLAAYLASLPPGLITEATGNAGLQLSDLPQEHQRRWFELQPSAPKALNGRMRIVYVPAGWYVWVPVVTQAEGAQVERLPIAAARTPDEALDAALRLHAGANRSQIRRSTGVLAVSVTVPGGETWWVGKPPTLALPGS